MRILVAVDLTLPSLAALSIGRELAIARGAELVIVNVVTGEATGSVERLAMRAAARGVLPDELAVQDASRRMEAFLRSSGPPAHGERALVEVGDPAEVIAEVARRERASTVVVGTHGRGRIGHAVLGSVARDVMSRVSCEVVAVHPPPPAESPGGAPRDR